MTLTLDLPEWPERAFGQERAGEDSGEGAPVGRLDEVARRRCGRATPTVSQQEVLKHAHPL
jgi:hypothetical protein